MGIIIAFTLIIFGTCLGVLMLWKIFDIVRNSIKKNKGKYEDDKFDRLAKAFIQHRKDTDRRLKNIEAILSSETPEQEQLDKPGKTIGSSHSGQSTSRNTSNIEVS